MIAIVLVLLSLAEEAANIGAAVGGAAGGRAARVRAAAVHAQERVLDEALDARRSACERRPRPRRGRR